LKWIVDTSVALKWYFPEAHSEISEQLLKAPNQLFAPSYLWIEFDNVLAKKIRLGEVDAKEAIPIRQALRELSIRLHDVFDLLDTAFEIALATRRSVYDSTFLALAVRADARLVTADRRFFDGVTASPFKTSITWIADLKGPG
jgi:predicted nucleic acid-binding protein